jgi:hypothetical protein
MFSLGLESLCHEISHHDKVIVLMSHTFDLKIITMTCHASKLYTSFPLSLSNHLDVKSKSVVFAANSPGEFATYS